jgi:hypothetical protein
VGVNVVNVGRHEAEWINGQAWYIGGGAHPRQ